MISLSRRQWTLGAVLTVTLAAVVWVSSGDPEPDTAKLPAAREAVRPSSAGATRKRLAEDSVVSAVEPSRLIRVIETRKVGDPFEVRSFLPVATAPKPAITVAAPPPPPPAPPPPPPPVAPPFPWTFMGRLIEDPQNPAVFLARADRLTVARIGDTLDSVWKVNGMDARGLRVEYLPLKSNQTVSLPSGSDVSTPGMAGAPGALSSQGMVVPTLPVAAPGPQEGAQDAQRSAAPANAAVAAPAAVSGIEVSSGFGNNPNR